MRVRGERNEKNRREGKRVQGSSGVVVTRTKIQLKLGDCYCCMIG